MNHVVTFLSGLCSSDSNSSVKRMLNVCSEFERIAKVVLDKQDKDAHSRRKRKQQDDKVVKKPAQENGDKTPQVQTGGTSPATSKGPRTPQPSQPGNIPNVFTPPDMSKYLSEEVKTVTYTYQRNLY